MTTKRIAIAAAVTAVLLAVIALVTVPLMTVTMQVRGWSGIALIAILCVGIQWLAWIPASLLKTEKFFDLLGGGTFVLAGLVSLGFRYDSLGTLGQRNVICTVLMTTWAFRLMTFLARRAHERGDTRFDEIKINPPRFFVVWTMQGLWTFLTALPVYVMNLEPTDTSMTAVDFIFMAYWSIAFLIEIVADRQKAAFLKTRTDAKPFMTTGLWQYLRHPNYLGEIMLWVAMTVICARALSGIQLLIFVSPIFVFVLLRFVSGVPMLEAAADEKWGDRPDYQAYKAKTPRLFPMLWRL